MSEVSAGQDENVIADWPIVAVVLTFCGGSYLFLLQYGIVRDVIQSASTNLTLYFAMWIFIIFGLILFRLAVDRPDSPIAHVGRTVLNRQFFQRTIGFAGILLCLALFMPFFSAFKSAIPFFNPFDWDETFIAWDRAIFLGYDAWVVLQPFLGFPIITSGLSGVYHLWILLIYAGSVIIGVYQPNRMLRQRYFVGYFLIWSIIGIGFANALSSVGPVFVGPILGMDTFDNQMAYLNEANRHWPVMVLEVQDMLLQWHNSGDHGLGRGITAMPSMHVALAFMFFLAMRQISTLWSRLALAFLVLIFIGSVHLAYHYAVDGIIAILLVWPIWWVAGHIVRLPQKKGFTWLGVPLLKLLSNNRQVQNPV